MAGSSAAAVLTLLAERLSIMDSSSYDSNSSIIPSPSSAATSFELPFKGFQHQLHPKIVPDLATPPVQPRSRSPPPSSRVQPQISSTPPSSFLALPSDIHHLILTDYLPYDSIVALRATASHFHSLIPPPTLKRLRQTVIFQLLADERALLKKWLPQPYGRYHGRPSHHMTCYSCLQSLPTTEFFSYQVSGPRGMGRSRAVERWCKPCGLQHGKIRHGKWIEEVSYGVDDQFRYQNVMGGELKLKNPCVSCPPKDHYGDQPVWWGCVGCFEKEEKRLQKQDSERRRDVRGHCSKVKRGVKAFVKPENLRDFGQEVRWWCRANVGWHAMVRQGWSFYWWAKDESLVARASRTCGRVGRVLDPRQMQEPGQKLGRKAKRAVGAVLDLGKKNKEKGGSSNTGDEMSTAFVEGCIICCAAARDPTLVVIDVDPTPPKAASLQQQQQQQQHHHNHNHFHIPSPHREVRCWRCWRAKRSRRRRRYDDGMAYDSPLPQDRWCGGCQAEHARFVALGREKKGPKEEKERNETKEDGKEEKDEEEGEAEFGLGGLFGEV